MSSKPQNRPTPEQEKKKATPNIALKYSGMAFQMAAIMAVGLFIGQKLDDYFQTSKPYITILCILLFGFAAFYYTLKDLLKRPK